MLKITIEGELPDLNTYIHALNRNRFVGAKIKREGTDSVVWQSKKYRGKAGEPPYHITFHWFCKNMRKDKDNISSMGRKCVLDGLQEAGVIPQDTWKVVDGFTDHFLLDKSNPRVEVTIQTCKKDSM